MAILIYFFVSIYRVWQRLKKNIHIIGESHNKPDVTAIMEITMGPTRVDLPETFELPELNPLAGLLD